MKIRYEDKDHRYWVDGNEVPSITQVLTCATYDEFDMVPKAVLAKKAKEGTEFAKMVEDWHAGTFDVMAANIALLDDFDAFLDWVKESGAEILQSEMIVASKKYGYAGRLDLVAHLPDIGVAMIDIKRTYDPPASGGPQTAAQVLAYGETAGVKKVENMPRFLLHFKDGRCTLTPQTDKSDLKTFLAALTVTSWRIQHGKRY